MIHPPMLYLGYVGFIAPFAFAIASLATKQPGDEWIKDHPPLDPGHLDVPDHRRPSRHGMGMCGTWMGRLLGMGSGGKCFPAPLDHGLPRSCTRDAGEKGMMKVWNMVLVSSTFFLYIFGTFSRRSGIVQSVRVFRPHRKYFVGFMAISISLTLYLILSRLEYLKSESQMESVLSRESSFMFNNLILLASASQFCRGTLFPVITEAMWAKRSASINPSSTSEHSDCDVPAAAPESASGSPGDVARLKSQAIVPGPRFRLRRFRGIVRSRHPQLLRADVVRIVRLRAGNRGARIL